MNTYFVKTLLFIYLINTLILPYYENSVNNHYDISSIQNNTQRTTTKSRLLAQTQKHNPHYHNDPELKEMIDKLNEEAIKKYQQTHEPYEQLKELVEKNGTKLTGGNGAEHVSSTEKELLETYEELFGEENHIMLKSGRYPNDDDRSDKSSTCECTDINNTDLTKKKGKDKYLENLKERCKGGIGFCAVGSVLLTLIGLAAAKAAAFSITDLSLKTPYSTWVASVPIFKLFQDTTMTPALQAVSSCTTSTFGDIVTPATTAAMGAFPPYGIAALVLLIIAVVLIILYIWLYIRRKRSLKHECKKHLCK
ncbi:stevor PIR protein, putative [Plasmodium reichenowi]|uniref:Stevor PIR protein, putative n=1 Tax=Plasmodium reichenowi TaxID=5854 RepID=A0A2P9DSW6_PLARE|nr:stevor PIR protein, putative [Plasmodium reichenowi]